MLKDFVLGRPIESLELRRLRNDMVLVYKMFFGLVDMNFGEYFTLRADRPSAVDMSTNCL